MELSAEKRNAGKASSVRKAGNIPAIVYNNELNMPVAVERRAFDKVFRSQGTSNIIELQVDGDSHDVLVKAVQMDKRRREPQHIDFYKVRAGQKVEVGVQIDFVGTAQGVKEGGLLDIQRREIAISILPRLIPHGIEVDISELTIGDALHVEDVAARLPEEAEILDELGLTLVTVVPPRLEVEEETTEEVLEPELIGSEGEEGEEGEAPAEDAADDSGDDD